MLRMAQARRRVDLMGVPVDPLTLREACEVACEMVAHRAGALIFNLNVDTWMKLRVDSDLRAIFQEADLVLVDGTPMVWAARILGVPLPERVSGSDFFPFFCGVAAKEGYGVFLFGANPGVADRAAQTLRSAYPELRISTYAPPFGFERDEVESRRAIEMVKRAHPDVLFVALPQPRQEKWLARHRDELEVPVAMGVGSSFDYLAGRLRRAPKWMQRAGLEWFCRLLQEPRRLWRRYLVDDVQIVYYVVRAYVAQRLAASRRR